MQAAHRILRDRRVRIPHGIRPPILSFIPKILPTSSLFIQLSASELNQRRRVFSMSLNMSRWSRIGPRRTLFLGFLLLLSLRKIESRFAVEENILRVTSPDKIKGTYDSGIGDFGIPQYCGSMAGTVYYPKGNRKGCEEFSDFSILFGRKSGA